RRRRFDYRVDDIGIALRDVEPDAAEITGRHSLCDARPGVAAVGRSPQTAPGPAAREAELASAALIRRCDERSPVGRDDDVRRSPVAVYPEHLLPRRASVLGAIEAAFVVRAKQMADGGDEHDVGVVRIDDNATDRLRFAQTHVPPRGATVHRLVNAVAPGRALAIVGF